MSAHVPEVFSTPKPFYLSRGAWGARGAQGARGALSAHVLDVFLTPNHMSPMS